MNGKNDKNIIYAPDRDEVDKVGRLLSLYIDGITYNEETKECYINKANKIPNKDT